MSKPAVAAALSIALSFGATCQTRAQEPAATGDGAIQKIAQSQQQQGLPTGFKAPQATSNQVNYPGKLPGTWQTNPTTGIGSFQSSGSGEPAATSTTTTTESTTPATGPSIPPPRPLQTKAIPGFPGYPRVRIPAPPPIKPVAVRTTTTASKKDETMVVQQGPLRAAQKAGWSRFDEYITLSNGQDQLSPLTLQVNNGVAGPPFTAMRLMLSGRQIASEKNFTNNVMTMSMVGALGNGSNQLVISAYGPAGAKLQWKVYTLKPTLSSATPKEVSAGDTITITGKNFSPSTTIDQMFIGNKAGTVTKASATSLEATIPDGLTSGDQKLTVKVGGVETKPLVISIKLVPELTSVDMFSSPPGQQITVSGKNFAAAASDNQVLIGGSPASIVSSSPSSISCIIPDIYNPSFGVPIVVKSKNVKSKNELKIDVQRRVIPNDGGVPRY
jgi:hypothetical protein